MLICSSTVCSTYCIGQIDLHFTINVRIFKLDNFVLHIFIIMFVLNILLLIYVNELEL